MVGLHTISTAPADNASSVVSEPFCVNVERLSAYLRANRFHSINWLSNRLNTDSRSGTQVDVGTVHALACSSRKGFPPFNRGASIPAPSMDYNATSLLHGCDAVSNNNTRSRTAPKYREGTIMPTRQRITFTNHTGEQLAAALELPDRSPRAYALLEKE